MLESKEFVQRNADFIANIEVFRIFRSSTKHMARKREDNLHKIYYKKLIKFKKCSSRNNLFINFSHFKFKMTFSGRIISKRCDNNAW